MPITFKTGKLKYKDPNSNQYIDLDVIGVNNGGGSVTGAVHYDEAQDLTEEEKAQARENIGAGTGNGNGGEVVEIDGYVGSVISDAISNTPISVEVFLPKLEGVEHFEVVLQIKYADSDSSAQDIIIDLTELSEPLESGWVELLADGTVNIYDGTTYELITLPEKVEPLLALNSPFKIEAWADDFDLEITPITYVEYQLSAKCYTDNNAVLYSKAQSLTTAEQAQARENIGIDNMLRRSNSIKLCDNTTPDDNTRNGITFTWTGNNKCVVSGLLTSLYSFSKPCAIAAPLPTREVVAGGTYFVRFKSTGDSTKARAVWFVDNPGGAPRENSQIISSDTFFTIPANAENFSLDIYVPENAESINETVEIGLYTAPSNLDLWNMIQELAAHLNG